MQQPSQQSVVSGDPSLEVAISVDIESTGFHNAATNKVVIAIGAVLVSLEGGAIPVHKQLFLPCLTSDVTFERDCWERFWSKHTDQLELLKIDGAYVDVIADVAKQFYQFILECIQWAKDSGRRLRIVSDNPSFDIFHLNNLLMSHGLTNLPLTHILGHYQSIYDTNSMQRGVSRCNHLQGYRAEHVYGDDEDGVIAEMEQLYEIPPSIFDHDHHPVHDAYTIARSYIIMEGVEMGRFARKGGGCYHIVTNPTFDPTSATSQDDA